jgi:drug/metabolite transporter (DMT)-like permease
MNPHSTQVLALIIVSMWAIAGTRGAKGRWLVLLFIVVLMIVCLTLGFVIGLHRTAAIRDDMAVSLMIFLGVIGAVGCVFRNRRRSQSWPFTVR